MAEPKTRLTVFLLKSHAATALKKELAGATPVPMAAPLDGFYVPLPSAPQPPPWVAEVNKLLPGSTPISAISRSPAGLLVVVRGNDTFVVTFGHGWMKLKPEWLETDFGRKVVLNAIRRDELVAVRSEQVFAKWHRSTEQAPRAAAVEEFGVEFDRDLIAAIEGTPTRKTQLGKKISGSTSLRCHVPIETLATTLDYSAKLFRSQAYKKVWPEVDNLIPIADPVVIDTLEKKLDGALASGKPPAHLVMFTPTGRRDRNVVVDSYVFGRHTKTAPTAPYLDVQFWLNHLQRSGLAPSVAQAKSTPIHLLSDDQADIDPVTAFDCFGYELSHGGRQYVLSSGVWYQAESDFVKRTEDFVGHLPLPSVKLPAWNRTENEGAYNKQAAKKTGSLHFDAKNIHFGGGQSKFEFCDFMHVKSKTLFFAKIASKSSGMSHLMEQARRTAELLFAPESAYRVKLAKVVINLYPNADVAWLDSRPRSGDVKLCFVSLGRSALELPFFAKCGLARAVKDLQLRGHDVTFVSV